MSDDLNYFHYETCKGLADCKADLFGSDSKFLTWILHSKLTFNTFLKDPIKAAKNAKGEWKALVANENIVEIASRIRSVLTCLQVDQLYSKEILMQKSTNYPMEKKFEGSYIPFDDQYYSLEYDAELLQVADQIISQESKRKDSIMQSQQSIQDPLQSVQSRISNQSTSSQSKDDDSALVEAPIGAKYLLSLIKRSAGQGPMKAAKQIVTSILPKKSKWGDEHGKNRLYNQLDKVLSDLRNYVSHSFPFTKPVQKKEAPNYYEVIKHPMDLLTMQRKLKNLSYQSKAEFHKDLNLIWENCFTYNTHPESIYRHHASQMRKKADDLMLKVQELVVKNDEESEEDEDVEVDKSAVDLENSVSVSVSGMESKDGQSDGDGDVDMEEEDELEDDEEKQDFTTDSNFLVQQWKEKTNLIRAQYLKARQEQLKLPFPDRAAIIPNDTTMDAYLYHYNWYIERQQILHKHIHEDDHDESDFSNPCFSYYFLPELYPYGVPISNTTTKRFENDLESFFKFEDVNNNPIPSAPLPSLSEYDHVHIDANSPWNAEILNNISELKRIKETYNKIIAKQANTTPDPPLGYNPFVKSWREEDLPPFHLDPSSAAKLAERSCAWLLAHNGFDAVTPSALSALGDLLSEVLITSGRTIRSFCDKHGSDMTDIEIASHSLQELGIQNPMELHAYANQHISRYSKKLYDLRRRLEVAWIDFSEGVVHAEDQNDMDIERHADGIMSGTFLEDLDVDFLGIKELGLDFKIPSQLWHKRSDGPIVARVKRSMLPTVNNDMDVDPDSLKIEVPDPWPLVVPSNEIGLLSGMYQRLQTTTDGMIEDEFKPKSKEAKQLIKIANAGGRKKIILTGLKKKSSSDKAGKTKKERKKKKKDSIVVTTPQQV